MSRDASGQENVLGMDIAGMGMQPMITGNARVFAFYQAYIGEHRARLESAGHQQTIHLLRFRNREELKL